MRLRDGIAQPNQILKDGTDALGSKIIAVPRSLCTQDLLAVVAHVTGGLTALDGDGLWIDGGQKAIVEPVTLLLISGTEVSTQEAVSIVRRHLTDRGEEALYILDAGSAKIVKLGTERSTGGIHL